MASGSKLREVDPYGPIGDIEIIEALFKPKFSRLGEMRHSKELQPELLASGMNERALRGVEAELGFSPGPPE